MSCQDFGQLLQAIFPAGKESPVRGPQDITVVVNRQESSASGGVTRLMGQWS